jgi:hypothetical protein
VDFDLIAQAVHIGIAISIFVVGFVHLKSKFRPMEGAWCALGLIALGTVFEFVFSALFDREWPGLAAFLSMQRGSIGYGSSFVAIGYGLLAYSTVRGIGFRRRGDG